MTQRSSLRGAACTALLVLLCGADSRGIMAVHGSNADNTAIVGSPINVGGIAKADGAASAAQTDGNASTLRTDLQGRLFVRESHPFFFSCALAAITATTSCKAAPGAAASLYVTDVWLANGSTTASTLSVATGTGTNCATGIANVTPGTPLTSSAAAGAWMTFSFRTPIKVTANQAVCCRTTGSTAFACLLSGYTAP